MNTEGWNDKGDTCLQTILLLIEKASWILVSWWLEWVVPYSTFPVVQRVLYRPSRAWSFGCLWDVQCHHHPHSHTVTEKTFHLLSMEKASAPTLQNPNSRAETQDFFIEPQRNFLLRLDSKTHAPSTLIASTCAAWRDPPEWWNSSLPQKSFSNGSPLGQEACCSNMSHTHIRAHTCTHVHTHTQSHSLPCAHVPNQDHMEFS